MPATQVLFVNQPVDTTTGTVVKDSVGNPIQVRLADGGGVTVPDNGTEIDITVNAIMFAAFTVNGIATFSSLTVNAQGNFSLAATSTGLSPATSSSFTVVTADTIAFLNQPTNTIVNYPLTPAIQVALKSGGSTISASGANITLNVMQGSTVISTFTVATVSGVSTFSAVSLAVSGSYTLKATYGPLLSSSNSFSVYNADHLTFTQQPTNTTVGGTINPQVMVAVEDSLNSILSVNVTITLNVIGPSPQTLNVTTNNGVSTFPITMGSAGSYHLTATITTLSTDSNTFSVLTASSLAFIQQPSNSSTNRPVVPAVKVAIKDSGGVIIPVSTTIFVDLKDSANVTITTYSALSDNGIATFSNISAGLPGSYHLVAYQGALSVTSNLFTVISRTSLPDTPEVKKYKFTATLLTDVNGNTIDVVATGELLPAVINTYVIAGAYRDPLTTLVPNAATEMHMDVNGRLIVSSGDVFGQAIKSQPLSMGSESATLGALTTVTADGEAVRLRASRSGVSYTTITDSVGSAGVSIGQDNGTPFATSPVGVVLAGQYTTPLPTLTNNSPFVLRSDLNARLLVSPDLNGVGTDALAAPTAPVGFFVTFKYTAALPSYAAGSSVTPHTDISGRLLVSPGLNGVGTDQTAGPANPDGFFVTAQFKTTLPTYTDGQSSTLHADSRGRLQTIAPNPSTSVITPITSTTSNVILLLSNLNRQGVIIYNNSTSNLFIKFGVTASLTDFSIKITANSYYELKEPVYTVEIDGIWYVMNGNALITELTL